jgi:hypothetical protein
MLIATILVPTSMITMSSCVGFLPELHERLTIATQFITSIVHKLLSNINAVQTISNDFIVNVISWIPTIDHNQLTMSVLSLQSNNEPIIQMLQEWSQQLGSSYFPQAIRSSIVPISNKLTHQNIIHGLLSPINSDYEDYTINLFISQLLPSNLQSNIEIRSFMNKKSGTLSHARSFSITHPDVINLLPIIPAIVPMQSICWKMFHQKSRFCSQCGIKGHSKRRCTSDIILICIHCRTINPNHTADECEKKSSQDDPNVQELIVLCSNGILDPSGVKIALQRFDIKSLQK